MKTDKIVELFNRELVVLNMGLKNFHENIIKAKGKSIDTDWSPPAYGDTDLLKILARLKGRERK